MLSFPIDFSTKLTFPFYKSENIILEISISGVVLINLFLLQILIIHQPMTMDETPKKKRSETNKINACYKVIITFGDNLTTSITRKNIIFPHKFLKSTAVSNSVDMKMS